jgi:diguanylate cyclase (GGDEF)-like protein
VATICVIIVFPLRFMYAVVFAVLRTLSVVLVAVAFSHPSFPQMVASAFILVVPLPFLLIANYRSEKATRTAWLLATRETLRVFALESERSQLLTVANIDGLTGISNRGYFNRKIAAWSRTRSSSRLQARLILLDVDFFKRFNDTYGHLEGDHCLRSIARVIGESIRGRDDFAFRYGGEEFGVLLFNITDDEALHAAERLCGRVEDLAIPHLRRGDGVSVVTVSSGVSRGFLPSEQAVQLMIADADRALYAAKSAGRNRVHPAFPAIACPSAE